MNIKKKEGGFFASKVRQYLNEYSGVDLLEGLIRKAVIPFSDYFYPKRKLKTVGASGKD